MVVAREAVGPRVVRRGWAPERTPKAAVEAFLQDQQAYGGRGGTGATKATVWTYRKLLMENSNAWAQPEPDGCGGSFDQGKIDDYLSRMKNSGIAEETWAKVVRHLKVFTKWAARAYPDDITADPLAEVSVRSKERVKWIPTRENVDALLAACEGQDFYDRRLRLMLTLYAGSGLRRAEILSARIEDVNTTTRTITVTRKGGDQQTVPIGLKTIAALRDYLATRPGWQKEDWLITDADGGRIRDDYATKIIRALMKKAGPGDAFAMIGSSSKVTLREAKARAVTLLAPAALAEVFGVEAEGCESDFQKASTLAVQVAGQDAEAWVKDRINEARVIVVAKVEEILETARSLEGKAAE